MVIMQCKKLVIEPLKFFILHYFSYCIQSTVCNVLASDLFRNLGTSKFSIPFACLYNYSVSILNKRQFFFIKRLLHHEGVRGNTLSWTSWQLWCWRKRHFWDLILRLERLYRKWLWPLLLRIRPFRTYSTLSQIAHLTQVVFVLKI